MSLAVIEGIWSDGSYLFANPSNLQEELSPYQTQVPFFLLGGSSEQSGALRLLNHSSEQGVVQIYTIEDDGTRHGPAEINIRKRENMLVYADELVKGSSRVELVGLSVSNEGAVRLEVISTVRIEAISYTVESTGLLGNLSSTTISESGCWRVSNFLSKDSVVTSRLRLVNQTEVPANIQITARDDLGQRSDTISMAVQATQATWLTAAELEDGESEKFEGRLGNGTGEWHLAVQSDQPLVVMNLLQNSQGRWTNLSLGQIQTRGQCWLNPTLAHADQSVKELLDPYINDGASPGLYAAIIDKNGVSSVAASGVKKQGSPTPASIYDLLHVGSIGKAMTTVMIATLIEDDLLPNGWTTSIEEVFPELRSQIHENYHEVTILDLLKHESGLARQADNWALNPELTIIERRKAILLDNLEEEPITTRGSFQYSHLGYTVAAAMVEQITSKSWEELMQERLFDPLGMDSAGFGPPGSSGSSDESWGHQLDNGEWVPNQTDLDPAYAPAGGIHVSIEDWTKFIHLWLPAVTPNLLSRDAIDQILVLGEQRAVVAGAINVPGWFLYPNIWGHGISLNHVGSNGRWHAQLWILRESNRAFFVVANSSDLIAGSLSQETLPMLNDVLEDLIKRPTPNVSHNNPVNLVVFE